MFPILILTGKLMLPKLTNHKVPLTKKIMITNFVFFITSLNNAKAIKLTRKNNNPIAIIKKIYAGRANIRIKLFQFTTRIYWEWAYL